VKGELGDLGEKGDRGNMALPFTQKGEGGARGEPGTPGEAGLKGAEGDLGAEGEKGREGPVGDKGHVRWGIPGRIFKEFVFSSCYNKKSSNIVLNFVSQNSDKFRRFLMKRISQ
jgi:hypothetical protein